MVVVTPRPVSARPTGPPLSRKALLELGSPPVSHRAGPPQPRPALHVQRQRHAVRQAGTPRGDGQYVHSRDEATRLVEEATLHAWLCKRRRPGMEALARTYLSSHRRRLLRACFDSIDTDGSGSISRSELGFALDEIGLGAALAALAHRNENTDGEISFGGFVELVATVGAREAQRKAGRGGSAWEPKGSKPPPKNAASSLGELVERAASFPLGLLANAQAITRLINGLAEATEPDPTQPAAEPGAEPSRESSESSEPSEPSPREAPPSSLAPPPKLQQPKLHREHRPMRPKLPHVRLMTRLHSAPLTKEGTASDLWANRLESHASRHEQARERSRRLSHATAPMGGPTTERERDGAAYRGGHRRGSVWAKQIGAPARPPPLPRLSLAPTEVPRRSELVASLAREEVGECVSVDA